MPQYIIVGGMTNLQIGMPRAPSCFQLKSRAKGPNPLSLTIPHSLYTLALNTYAFLLHVFIIPGSCRISMSLANTADTTLKLEVCIHYKSCSI